MVNWRNDFQCSVNKLADGDHLKFTCALWLQEGKRISPKEEDCCDELAKVCAKDHFPHLDMKLVRSNEDKLHQAHMQPDQQLRCLNTDSTHT